MVPLQATSPPLPSSGTGGINVRFWILAILVPISLITACHRPVPPTPLNKILTQGELIVIVHANPDGFYWSGFGPGSSGTRSGFEYELVRLLARDLGVGLEIKAAKSAEEMLKALLAGEGDMIAGADFPPGLGKDRAIFVRPFLNPRVLPIFSPRRSSPSGSSNSKARTPEFHVHRQGIFPIDAMGHTPSMTPNTIIVHPELNLRGVVSAVAAGRFPAALLDEPQINRLARHFPKIRRGAPWEVRRELAWVLPPHAQALKTRLDRFILRLEAEGRLAGLVAHHFPGKAQDPEVGIRSFHKRIPVRLPTYLDTIRQSAARYGFEWELIAALTYQESLWNPGAVSSAGARGLMQLLPDTAKSLGVADIHNPRENIWAGVRYLRAYYDFYNRAPAGDRLKIALAAYNVGIGHVLDARNLARARGLDPNRWASLMETLPLLSRPEYYRTSQYGYCRGEEPVRYVDSIMIYAGILKGSVLALREEGPDPGTVFPSVPESPPFRCGR